MKEDKSQLLNYAMYAGVYLGLFWVFKYFFVVIGLIYPALNFLGTLLSIGTPVLLFIFLLKYSQELQDGKMGFWHGVKFSILLFFFASILESMIVFIHVQWIDPTFISDLFESMGELAKTIGVGEKLSTRLSEQPLPSPFDYVFSNVIMADVFLGLLLSLFIVPLSTRYKQKQNI